MSETRYADTPRLISDSGIAFRYDRGCKPNLTPIVLLHGLSQQADYWQPVIKSLGSDHGILTIDLRGHGDSRYMAPDYRISTVSSDCIEVMDEVGIDRVCIVGHSLGASVALHVAAENPNRTNSCVLIDGGVFTPANILSRGSITREALRTALAPPKGPFAKSELQDNFIPVGNELTDIEQESIMAAVYRTYAASPNGGLVTTIGFERHMAVLEAFFDYSPDSDLERLAVPSWILIAYDLFAPTGPTGPDDLDDWAQVKFDVDEKVRGKMNIALQHWYGAVHDVPLYWPDRVAQLISHAAMTQGVS